MSGCKTHRLPAYRNRDYSSSMPEASTIAVSFFCLRVKDAIPIQGLPCRAVRSSSSRSSCNVIYGTGFRMAATVAAQEWTAIAADTAVARRSTVPRRLGSSISMDDS
jgi:hypothetical protein